MTARSYLYVPGDRRDRLDSAPGRGADALILDLEDAVPVSAKQAARETVRCWLDQLDDAPCQLWLRINGDDVERDVYAAVTERLAGVVVPKVEPPLLDRVDSALSRREQELRLKPGRLRVLGLVESAAGLLQAPASAAHPRVDRLGIGEADLMADLRLVPTADREELTALRLHVVVACAAAGIDAPVAPTSTDFRDLDSLRRTTEQLLRLGFRARTAIHPAQVAVVNETFTPTVEEVERAREVVERFQRAQGEGSGVVTDAAGRMVDLAVVRSAREVLARAEVAVRD